VARNPVVDKATKSQASDIPDNGMLISVNSSGDPGPVAMPLLYNASPISHVSRIQIPIYLMIGSNDRRVPPSQGYLLYHELRALRRENVKLNVYDDCHPLSKVVTHSNVMINAALFYEEYRESKKSTGH
jgi:acylaminoacyl-peptidase